MLFSLKHPNIVTLYGVCHDPVTGFPRYLVMERAMGTLRAFLRRRGRLQPHELLVISRDPPCTCTHCAPSPSHIGDLKDDNVLVFEAPSGLTAT